MCTVFKGLCIDCLWSGRREYQAVILGLLASLPSGTASEGWRCPLGACQGADHRLVPSEQPPFPKLTQRWAAWLLIIPWTQLISCGCFTGGPRGEREQALEGGRLSYTSQRHLSRGNKQPGSPAHLQFRWPRNRFPRNTQLARDEPEPKGPGGFHFSFTLLGPCTTLLKFPQQTVEATLGKRPLSAPARWEGGGREGETELAADGRRRSRKLLGDEEQQMFHMESLSLRAKANPVLLALCAWHSWKPQKWGACPRQAEHFCPTSVGAGGWGRGGDHLQILREWSETQRRSLQHHFTRTHSQSKQSSTHKETAYLQTEERTPSERQTRPSEDRGHRGHRAPHQVPRISPLLSLDRPARRATLQNIIII